ncbi:MAG: D-hexose-6-phosphate mutarotase [Gammaproteobacteria bacterium]
MTRNEIMLEATDGSRVRLHSHGGQVLSWRTADGTEQLFLSTSADFTRGAAIRGGIPVIFPQFAALGPLPKHGFARNRDWQPDPVTDPACRVLTLVDDASTHALWPHRFLLRLRVRIAPWTLEVRLEVTNRDPAPCPFTAALHTYLRVAELQRTRILGLEARPYIDAAAGGIRRPGAAAPVTFPGEVDRVYADVASPVRVVDATGTRVITQEGFPDIVVWNPGAERAADLADLEPGGAGRMVCVEAAAAAHPVHLASGATWVGSQSIHAAPQTSQPGEHR